MFPSVSVAPPCVEVDFADDLTTHVASSSPVRTEVFHTAQVVRALTDQMEYLAGSVAAQQA